MDVAARVLVKSSDVSGRLAQRMAARLKELEPTERWNTWDRIVALDAEFKLTQDGHYLVKVGNDSWLEGSITDLV
jgi:hypothetical protein